MNTPTTHDVVKRLAELSRMLDDATDQYAVLDEEWVRHKAAYVLGFARAFINASGSMDLRKQVCNEALADEFLTMELAEQKVRACRERIRTIRDQIEVGRSLNSAVKSEWAAGAVGQT